MVELESWIIPFTFIPGVGMLVLSTANRLYNVTTLIREIIQSQRHMYEHDLSILVKRTQLFHRALICFYAAVGLLACAALIGSFNVSVTVAEISMVKTITTSGIICVVIGSIQLIRESIIASRLIVDCKKTRERIKKLQRP